MLVFPAVILIVLSGAGTLLIGNPVDSDMQQCQQWAKEHNIRWQANGYTNKAYCYLAASEATPPRYNSSHGWIIPNHPYLSQGFIPNYPSQGFIPPND